MVLLSALLALTLGGQTPSAAAPDCSPADAIPATIAQIARDPGRYIDRCVQLDGVVDGAVMYDSRDAMYLVHRFARDGNFVRANRIHRIGLESEALLGLGLDHPVPGRIIGRVDSCELRAERMNRLAAFRGEPPPLIFMGGYCHYHPGPIVRVSSHRLGSGSFERLTGEAARRRFGNIAPIPADWPHREQLGRLAREFLAALRAGNRAVMTELHGVRLERMDDRDRAVLASLFDDPSSPWRQLRAGPMPETAIFISMAEDGVPLGRETLAGNICFCREASCAGRWPISFDDATNHPARPYVCTHLQAPQRGPTFETSLQNNRLREPARTAYRLRSTR